MDKNKSILTFFISGTGNHEEENELSEIEEILQNELTQNDDEDLRDPIPAFGFSGIKSLLTSRRRSQHDVAKFKDPKPGVVRWVKSKLSRRRSKALTRPASIPWFSEKKN